MNKGIAGSAGYGVGKVVIISDAKPEYENRTITDTDAEIKRYDDAVAAFTEKDSCHGGGYEGECRRAQCGDT